MKTHVKDPTIDDAWMMENTVQVIVRYNIFFQALLVLTNRLNLHVLKKSSMDVFGGTWDYADMWANKIMLAFSASVKTGKSIVDGSRFPDAVAAVAGAFKRRMRPTPRPSPPACGAKDEMSVKAEQMVWGNEAESALRLWAMLAPAKQEQPPIPNFNPSSIGMSELDRDMSM